MKILLISFSEHYTYQETIYNLFNEISNNNAAEIWTIGSKNLNFSFLPKQRNILVDCPSKPGIQKKSFSFQSLKKINSKISEIDPDIIIFYSVHLWNLPISMRFKNKAKIAHFIHDVIPHKGDKQEKMVFVYNWLVARMADTIFLHNNRFKGDFATKYNFDSKRIESTPLWRKYEEFSPLNHTGNFLFFGRINRYKGIHMMEDIVKKCPDIQFDIVGKVDNGLEEEVLKLSAYPNVHINTNYVSDKEMVTYFQKTDWVILPYESATQSGVVIDAYSFSRPVIAYDVGALNEQISNEETGFLVEPNNTSSFAETLIKCQEMSREEKEALSYNAWKYGYNKFSIQEGYARLIEISKKDYK